MDGRARSGEGGPTSASFCPACHKPVDALRAGQVAILDGAFRYFCDARCKADFVEVLSKRPSLEAHTAQPPPVSHVRDGAPRAESVAPVREPSRSQVDEVASVDELASEDEGSAAAAAPTYPEPPPSFPEPPPSRRSLAAKSVEPASEPALELSPRTLRSPKEDAAANPRRESTRWSKAPPWRGEPDDGETPAGEVEATAAPAPPEPEVTEAPPSGEHDGVSPIALAPHVGVVLGLLAPAVGLGGPAVAFTRLPLALAAAAIMLARRAFAPRAHGEPSALVVAAPILVLALAAALSTILGHPHAAAHASVAGVGAASALFVDVLLARARRDVLAVRARVARALSVSARVVRGDGVFEEEDALIKPGEQVVVEAGETIPVDGIVAAGDADVAPWLESPALLRKGEGDAVVAGAVVVSGRLRVNTTFSGAERAWLRLVGATPGRIDVAAPFVVLARRLVERGAPVVALLVGAAAYADNRTWLDVVVAAASSGLALGAFAAAAAAGLAHARGPAAAQRRGIVYKDASAFDAAARADVAVLCSRGTVLLGEPEIVLVEPITKDGVATHAVWRSEPRVGRASQPPSPEIARVLALAAGAEMSSSHPFASAVLREARARGVRPESVRSALGHSGLGVTALAPSGDKVIVGSRSFLLQEKVSVAIADARTAALEAEGRSVLLVALGGRLVGLLALQDGLRAGARAAVQRLHDARIEPVLLSGESRDTSETIARALDIEHVRPEILPAERGAEVRALADDGRVVAAIGHAATDDGALGAADVSIAMEAAGAAPGEWAVALASDDVRDAALALTLPRTSRDQSRSAVLVGGLTSAAASFALAFGIAPPVAAPVLGAIAAVLVLSISRESRPGAG